MSKIWLVTAINRKTKEVKKVLAFKHKPSAVTLEPAFGYDIFWDSDTRYKFEEFDVYE